MARNPSHFGSKSQPSPSGSSAASFDSIGSIGGSIGNPTPPPSAGTRAPRRDPSFRRRPAGVEGAPPLVDVDHQRRMVRGHGLALARLPVDLHPHRPPPAWRRPQPGG